MANPRQKPLSIRDEIHGDITFDPTLRQVIDHPYFQRLRYIKQLGLAEYVFPCATHSRFQHSLGASFLAGQYFETMLRGWIRSPFGFEGKCDGTKFYAERTRKALETVARDRRSREYWAQTAMLAGLLHDIGHGPWSHTFEYLNLDQDFTSSTSKMPGAVKKYFSDLESKKKKLKHEDLSVVYIFNLLKDLEDSKQLPQAMRFFLPVSLLVNKALLKSKFKSELETELHQNLQVFEYQGGLDVHTLIRPIISGPFDVDRMDYIQRDGRNCGVHIGGIEWRRIVTKLIPVLADHKAKGEEPSDVALISNIKNQHVLDDFIFSLFQMYAQVYMHPKIVGVEEIIRQLLVDKVSVKKAPTIDFDLHRSLSDDKFRHMLKNDFGVPEVEEILLRRPEASFHVARYPSNSGAEKDLKKAGYKLIDTLDRPMMKDSVGLFLFSLFNREEQKEPTYFVKSWAEVSPIAHQFYHINYQPKIWLETDLI